MKNDKEIVQEVQEGKKRVGRPNLLKERAVIRIRVDKDKLKDAKPEAVALSQKYTT